MGLALRSPDWAGAAASALGAAVWLWPLHCVPEAEAVLVSLEQQAFPVAPCWQQAALGAFAGEEAVVAVWAELRAYPPRAIVITKNNFFIPVFD